MSTSESFWTEDRVNVLTRRWCVDRASAGAIANEMGTTRSSVIGKVHRLDLHRAKQSPAPKEAVSNDVAAVAMPINGVAGVPLAEAPDVEDTEVSAVDAREPEAKPSLPVEVKAKVIKDLGEEAETAVLFMEATMFQCRFALWDENDKIEDKMCCGRRVVSGKSWCLKHYSRVFEPPRESRRRTPAIV